MKISCTNCGAPYEVDDAQIPPGGAMMKCSQCHATFNVKPAMGGPLSSGEIAAGWDLDMPGAAPPPPMAPPAPLMGGNNRYHIRRPSGKVFGPFLEQAIASMLEQGKLNGDEQVSLDGASWMTLAQVPGLSRFAAPGAGGGYAGYGSDPYADLPAPKGAIVPAPPTAAPGGFRGDMSDLPAPRGAIVPPPPGYSAPQPQPPAVGGELSLDGFDMDSGEADLDMDDIPGLPAPKGTIAPAPPPGRPMAGLGDMADLPAPKGYAPGPPPPPAPPRTGMDYGILDLGGEDDGFADLPAPKGGVTGLPAPRGAIVPPPPPAAPSYQDPGITDLPAPKDGITDLSAPVGVSGLPTPVRGVTDLPRPKEGYGNLDLGGGDLGGLDDLPVPAGRSVGLELDADFDLPVPKEMSGSGRDAEAPDLVAPVERRGSPAAASIDLLAPKAPSYDDDDEGDSGFSTFEPPPRSEGMEEPEPAFADLRRTGAGALEEEEMEEGLEGIEPLERPSHLKKRLLMVLAAVVGVILVGGITVGLVTDLGFFGLKALSGTLSKEKQAKTLIDGANLLLLQDTFKDYQQAAADYAQAASKLPPEDKNPLALQGQALACACLRFGLDPTLRTQARDLATRVTTSKEELTPQIKKLHGLLSLAFGKPDEGIATLTAISDQEPGDAQAAVYLGWGQLQARQPQKALTSFARALAAAPGHAGAMFGSARAHLQLQEAVKARGWLDRALQASVNHPGALLLKASLEMEANQRAAAEKTLKLATTAALTRASRTERGQGHGALGRLALLSGNNNEARKQYEQALKINPTDVDALVGLGNIHYAARVYSEALARYEQARSLDPTAVLPAQKVARTHIAMRAFTKAQKVLVEIRKIAPNAPEILFLLGLVEAAANNLDAAETNFNEAIKKKPTYFAPYQELSRLHLRRNKPAEAMAVLKTAGENLPASALVRNAEGEVLLATKQPESAQAKFEEALRLDTNLNQALFNLGLALHRRGQLDKALEQLLALTKKDSDFSGLSEELGSLYVALKEYAKAEAAYDRALKAELPSNDLRLAAAYAYNLAGKPDKAIAQTDEVIKENPALAYTRALRAEAFLLKKDKDEALIQIRQAVQREKTVYILVVKGRIHEARGEKADAVDAYEEVLKMDPSRIDVRFMRGRLLVTSGATKEGTKELLAVIKQQPGMAKAHLWLGIGYAETNKEAPAMAAFRAAVARDPKLGEAHFRLGQVLFDRRSFGPALSALKKAVELGGAEEGDEEAWLGEANYYLGEAALSLKQNKLAVEAYLRFKQLSPGSALIREVDKRLRSLGVSPSRQD